MRLTIGVCLLLAVSVSSLPHNISESSAGNKPLKGSSSLPQWMLSVRDFIIGPSGIVTKTKQFFTGDGEKSLSSLRSAIPKSRSEANKTLADFYRTLKTDATSRLIFVIYLNLAFMLVVYVALFICQIHMHVKQRRMDALLRQKKKWDSEDAAEAAAAKHGRQTRKPSLVRSEAGRPAADDLERHLDGVLTDADQVDWENTVTPSVGRMGNDGRIQVASGETLRSRKKEANYLSWGLFQDDETEGLPVEKTQQDSVSDEVFIEDCLDGKGERRNANL